MSNVSSINVSSVLISSYMLSPITIGIFKKDLDALLYELEDGTLYILADRNYYELKSR